MPAIRAATAGSRALRGDVEDTRVFARDLFDAAARHRTELVHAPFYGVRRTTCQTPAPNGSIHAKCGRAKLSGQAKTQEEAEKIILSLGNTVGVAEVDTSDLQVQQQAPQSTMYTVQKGDTLWAIAEKHYGKGKGAKHTAIVKANSPPVKNPDMIQPGWVLRIPPLT